MRFLRFQPFFLQAVSKCELIVLPLLGLLLLCDIRSL